MSGHRPFSDLRDRLAARIGRERLDESERRALAQYDAGWVNAVVEIVIPMDDVTVDDSKWAKQEALGRVMDRVIDALPEDMIELGVGRWEDMPPEPEST